MVDVQWEVQSGMCNLQMTHIVNRVEAQPINITDWSFKQTELNLTEFSCSLFSINDTQHSPPATSYFNYSISYIK